LHDLRASVMDTEHINAIGTLLADLSERTEQLRGYL
jgi:CHASE3 domain sensor protein